MAKEENSRRRRIMKRGNFHHKPPNNFIQSQVFQFHDKLDLNNKKKS